MTGFIEDCCKMCLRDCHTYSGRKSLPKRTRGHFHAGSKSVFGMTRGDTAPLAEVLEIIEAHIVTRQLKQRIQEH